MHDGSLEHIPDDALLATVRRLTAHSNVALAELLAHLGEVELRGIHRVRACASLYTYCVSELRMSEDAAFRRAKAARLVRQYPDVRSAIAKGELHLTGLLMIAPQLGGERHTEVLARARFRSKRELLRLMAELDPKPAVPSRVEPLGPAPACRATHAAHVESLMGPVRDLLQGARPKDWIDENAQELDATQADEAHCEDDEHSSAVQSASAAQPLHYKVQFTASQHYVDLLEEAIALLGHEKPRLGLPEVQLRALALLVAKLRRDRRGDVCDAKARDSAARANESNTDGPASAQHSPTRDVVVADGAAPARHSPTRDAPVTDVAAPARESSPPHVGKPAGRYIPRSVRRTVWERDGARCAYVDDRGVRCREATCLELHHRHAHALGGPNTADNLDLRCTAHNALAAEADFGREHMDRVRPSAAHVEV
jgi:hypothetical protein